jgi:hypothetical protein
MKPLNWLRNFKRVSFAAVWEFVWVAPTSLHAQVCPFENGGSTLENDGLVRTS